MESGRINYFKGIKLLNRKDLVLIISLLLIMTAGFISELPKKKADYIEVKFNDLVVGRYRLDIDQAVEINSGTILEIASGRFRLKSSACPRQYCVKQGWSVTQPIICVPQKLIISVVRDKKNKNMLITY